MHYHILYHYISELLLILLFIFYIVSYTTYLLVLFILVLTYELHIYSILDI